MGAERRFVIKRQLCVHDSKTKHYQIFRVLDKDSGKCAVILHHGSAKHDKEILPLYCGVSEIKLFKSSVDAFAFAQAKIVAKSVRGYTDWDYYNHNDMYADTIKAFNSTIFYIFKKEAIESINQFFFITNSLSDKDVVAEKSKTQPVKIKETVIEQNKQWATW